MSYTSDHAKEFKKFSSEVGRIHHAASRPAKHRRSKKRQDGVKYKVNNKMRGSYGTTDVDTKTITINKKMHKKDGESLLDTIAHEHMHLKHPRMHEKTVRKLTPKKIKHMSKKSKSRLYAKFN